MNTIVHILFFGFSHQLFATCGSFCHRRHDIPIRMVHYLKKNVVVSKYERCKEYHWERVEEMKIRVMKKYFDEDIGENQYCEVFCIAGIPACSMIYSKTNKYNHPNVEAFYMNKGMVLLFDAGPHMRTTLFRRYPQIDVRKAHNRKDFLLF
tara:strand:- start:807 stop:1259 length:453 start_codon:yes stop_codon:yes gene_type:complete